MGGSGGRAALRVLRIDDGRLEVAERPTPEPAGEQVLVEVAGTGVNRADLLQKMGRYPAPKGWPEDVPGLEHAGTVAAVGDGVRSLRPGDRVFGIVGGGGHASHVLTTESLCARIPEGLDPVRSGGIPEAYITAHDALFERARMRPGERVLIHGVGSGVGIAALQIARAAGATTVGTSRTLAKLERATQLGLDEGVLAADDMAALIGEVDVVIDLIGGDYLDVDVSTCRIAGRIVIVGLVAGARAQLDMGAVLSKRLQVTGTALRSRPEHAKGAAVAAFEREVVPLFERGVLDLVVDRVVGLEEAEGAYAAMASNETFGRIILAP